MNATFSIGLRLGARKAMRQGVITREQFNQVRSLLRDPMRDSEEFGPTNILEAVEDFVTAKALEDVDVEALEPGAALPTAFPDGITQLIQFLIDNMDEIMKFIQMIIALFGV